MLKEIDTLFSKKDFTSIFKLCQDERSNYFGYFLSTLMIRQRIGNPPIDDTLKEVQQMFRKELEKKSKEIRIQLLCNWMESVDLMKLWSKMLHPDSHIIFTNQNPHIWVIINAPPKNIVYDCNRTIVFQMEPNMCENQWGEWASPDKSKFLSVFTHENSLNTIEWHLSKHCYELLTEEIIKKEELCLSTILSAKYYDEGHKKRVDFIKYIENTISVHVYGSNSHDYRIYKGSLPYHQKDNGLIPYKYTFNAENHSLKNYCTEKIIDAILAECLCFYWGCPNLETILDSRCFIRLSLKDFEHDMEVVRKAIEEDEWSKRIHTIRNEKKRILNDLQFTRRLENILTNSKKSFIY